MLKAKRKQKGMPKVPKVSFWRSKKFITAGIVVVLIIAAVAAGVFLRWQQNQTGSGGQKGGDTSGLGQADGLAQNPLPDSVKDAQNLANTGKVDESNKQIGTSIANTSDNDEKYELYIQQGLNSENASKWDDAIQAYKSAEALKKTWTIYNALGRASESKGDKQAAINYYKQAIPLLSTDDPLYNVEKSQLEDKVKALGGSV